MGTIALQIVMSLAFKDHYNTKKELMQMSTVDFLTKAYNRNILNTLIEKDSYRFVSSLGEKVQLLLVDIDFFKVINDVHGHAAGDLVLKSTAHTIKSNIRKDDIFIRYGGEEFLIIMPRTERAEAKQIAERVRVAVENTENEVQKITISGGLSSYQDNYKDAIERADLALYRSKQEGRNKISVETSVS
jgi:diguanylate cyclase (GGDEF)-like protein